MGSIFTTGYFPTINFPKISPIGQLRAEQGQFIRLQSNQHTNFTFAITFSFIGAVTRRHCVIKATCEKAEASSHKQKIPPINLFALMKVLTHHRARCWLAPIKMASRALWSARLLVARFDRFRIRTSRESLPNLTLCGSSHKLMTVQKGGDDDAAFHTFTTVPIPLKSNQEELGRYLRAPFPQHTETDRRDDCSAWKVL